MVNSNDTEPEKKKKMQYLRVNRRSTASQNWRRLTLQYAHIYLVHGNT